MSIHLMSRRSFLQASGIAASGLALGVQFDLAQASSTSGSEINAFVHIAENGDTTIYCGRCEMGQGIATALPAAVADELEADWERVTVLQGDANEKFGPQATGGSNSINVMFQPMREAGAAAQMMLVAAAAERWKLPVSEVYAENHVIKNRQNQRTLGYGELATEAAKQAVPESVELKKPDQFRYIGQPLPRHDLHEVIAGSRTYGADVRVPGMKYAAIAHVPVMGGSVKSVDDTKARKMSGVVDVITLPRFENAYGTLGGVAVVADNSWTAEQAVKALEIEWAPGPHADYNSAEYKRELVATVEKPCHPVQTAGKPDAAFEAASQRHGATFVGGHLSHSPMEPMSSTVDVKPDRCEVWASTQDPAGIQRTLGEYLKLDPKAVTVHVMMAGGAFGRKFKCDYVQEAAALSKAVGAPVHLTWSREEDTRTGYYHSVSAQHIEAALDDQGNVTAWLHRAAFPAIGTTFNPRQQRPSEGDLKDISDHPYGIINRQIESGNAAAHTRIGWYRAVYAIFYGFAINVFTDELAHKAGSDTLDFYRQIYKNNQNPEQAEQVKRSLGVLNKAAENADWGREMPKGHGLGIAVHHSFESYVAMVVHAQVDGERVRVHRVDCVVDCGLVLNPDQATAQMEGAVTMGMSLALYTEVSFRDGAVENSNFHDYPVLRINEMPPVIEVEFINTEATPTGLGEPGVPTFAPALANAIFAAGGPRHRSLPMKPLKA